MTDNVIKAAHRWAKPKVIHLTAGGTAPNAKLTINKSEFMKSVDSFLDQRVPSPKCREVVNLTDGQLRMLMVACACLLDTRRSNISDSLIDVLWAFDNPEAAAPTAQNRPRVRKLYEESAAELYKALSPINQGLPFDSVKVTVTRRLD